MGKNYALSLEYGLGPYSRPRAQFFPIRTSRSVNNIYICIVNLIALGQARINHLAERDDLT